MSLLDDFAMTCVMMEKKRVPDGAGGYIVEWTEGAGFTAYPSMDTSLEARRAEKEGVTSLFSVLVEKNVPIEYHDVYRETATGETYRVTSNPQDKETPKSSTMALKSFTAERWALTK